MKQVAGALEVFEAVFSQVLQGGSGRQVLLHQLASRGREENLAAMARAHDAGSMVYIHADIAICRSLRFSVMQADTHPNRDAFGPGTFCENPLNGCGCGNRIGGTGKGDEEGISLGVNFAPMKLDEQLPQQVSALGQHIGVALPQLLQETRRACDIAGPSLATGS